MINIVMPVYNQAEYLRESVESILNQTFSDFELIVVNDGSTDRQITEIVDSYHDDRIKYISKGKNEGIGRALNDGFGMATRPFETWFAADNKMISTCLEDLLTFLNINPDLDFVYANTEMLRMDKSGKYAAYRSNIQDEVGPQEWDRTKLFTHFYLGVCWLWRREIRFRAGEHFQEEPCEDYDMILRMADAGGKFGYFNQTLAAFRRHRKSKTYEIRHKENLSPNHYSYLVQEKSRKRLKKLESEKPLVSIIMPAYNHDKFVGEAIESIINQSFKNWELIIVDDGSIDNTASICKKFTQQDARIKYIYQENQFTGAALNNGFKRARGQYRTWFASDNRMYPQNLMTLYNYLETHPDIDYVYGVYDYAYVDDDGRTVIDSIDSRDYITTEWEYGKFFQRSYFLGICWLWRKEIHEKVGEFYIGDCEDYDFALRLEEIGCKFKLINEKLGWYRQHKENVTSKYRRTKEDARVYEKKVVERAKRRRGLIEEKKFDVPSITKGKLKIAIVNLEFDCAGVGWNLRRGISEHTDHESLHIANKILWFCEHTDYRLDLNNLKEFEEKLKWADVLHFNQWIWRHRPAEGKSPYEWKPFNDTPLIDYDKLFKDRRVVFHFHAGEVLADCTWWLTECERVGAKIITCDPPSEKLTPELTWIPNVLELRDIKTSEARIALNTPLRIYSAHSPNDDRKNITLYKRHFETMKRIGWRLTYDIIHGLSKEESFERRRDYHISIESTVEGYIGMVGWESLAMSQVLIGRISDYSLKRYHDLGLDFPAINIDSPQEITQTVKDMNMDRLYLFRTMKNSRMWMDKHYQAERIANMYIDFYRDMG